MEIPKEQIIAFIQSKMGQEKATEAEGQLPDKVDPEKHAGLLGNLGVNPAELLAHVGGAGGLGGAAKGLLG